LSGTRPSTVGHFSPKAGQIAREPSQGESKEGLWKSYINVNIFIGREQLETYIQEHSSATLSHGICDDCMTEHFPQHKGKEYADEE
jgi:hypothetical protein